MIWFALLIIWLSGVAVGGYMTFEKVTKPANYKAICHICGTIAEGPNVEWVRSVLEFHGPCHKETEFQGLADGGWHSPGAAS